VPSISGSDLGNLGPQVQSPRDMAPRLGLNDEEVSRDEYNVLTLDREYNSLIENPHCSALAE
jgi:hypothetical protein